MFNRLFTKFGGTDHKKEMFLHQPYVFFCSLLWNVRGFMASASQWYNRERRERDKVPHLHTVLYMHFPQTIVNPLAVGDEYTYRWYIKTAITRTPSKAKNQLEWIVKLATKNQWAIHVLDHRVSFLSMLEADEGWTYTHILTVQTLSLS